MYVVLAPMCSYQLCFYVYLPFHSLFLYFIVLTVISLAYVLTRRSKSHNVDFAKNRNKKNGASQNTNFFGGACQMRYLLVDTIRCSIDSCSSGI